MANSQGVPSRRRHDSVPVGLIRPPEIRTDAYRYALALVVVLFLVTVDITDFLGEGATEGGSMSRYLLLVPVFLALHHRLISGSTLVRRPVLADRLLLVLGIYGLSGSLYGKYVVGTQAGALPAFAPIVLAALYLLSLEPMSEREGHRILVFMSWVGLTYASFNVLVNTGVIPGALQYTSYRNAKLLFLAMAVVAALGLRSRLKLVAVAVLAGIIFRTYPSATFALVTLVGAITLFITRPQAGNARKYVLAIGLLLLIFLAAANLDRTVGATQAYYDRVGKQNNDLVRLALLEEGVRKFLASPIAGDKFTGELTVTLQSVHTEDNRPFRAPLHNDYIMIASSGGAVALILFVGWIVATNAFALSRYRRLIAAAHPSSAALVRTLLVGFNAWMCSALFNPLLQSLGASAALYAVFGLLMVTARSADRFNDGWVG